MYAQLISMGISAALSASQAASSAKAGNKQADYQKQVADNNAAISRMEGAYARDQGAREAMDVLRKTGLAIGNQRAHAGASGVLVDSGSVMDKTADIAGEGSRAATAKRDQAAMEYWRKENAARGYEYSGMHAESNKVNVTEAAMQAGLRSAASSAASSMSSMGGK